MFVRSAFLFALRRQRYFLALSYRGLIIKKLVAELISDNVENKVYVSIRFISQFSLLVDSE